MEGGMHLTPATSLRSQRGVEPKLHPEGVYPIGDVTNAARELAPYCHLPPSCRIALDSSPPVVELQPSAMGRALRVELQLSP